MFELSWGLILISVFGLIFIFLFSGMPIAVALGSVGLLSSFLFLNRMGIVAYTAWKTSSSFILSAIPLFILMGHLILASGLSERLYNGTANVLGRVRGGLIHASIASCAMFASVTGSSVATAATIGTMSITEMEKRGYDKKMIYGSIAAGGTLGILIPPSTCMIIYAVTVGESIGDLFIAGVIPGIILTFLFMLFTWIRVKITPSLAPIEGRVSFKKMIKSVFYMWPLVLIFFTIIGGIYFGIMTPTESAAIGVGISLVFGIVSRSLNWKKLQQVLLDTLKTTVQLLFIMIGASIISGTLGLLRIPNLMAEWIVSLGLSPLAIMIIIYIIYLILGCFIDTVSMLLMTLPIFFPLVVSFGYDPIWFGIIIVIIVEAAMITPPVGLNVYVIHGLRPKQPISDVFLGSMPYFFIMLLFILILTTFPGIATWLPSTMITR